jgi:hypothetical protein
MRLSDARSAPHDAEGSPFDEIAPQEGCLDVAGMSYAANLQAVVAVGSHGDEGFAANRSAGAVPARRNCDSVIARMPQRRDRSAGLRHQRLLNEYYHT